MSKCRSCTGRKKVKGPKEVILVRPSGHRKLRPRPTVRSAPVQEQPVKSSGGKSVS